MPKLPMLTTKSPNESFSHFYVSNFLYYDCPQVLQVTLTWATVLRDLHPDMMEDVEYVVGKVDWTEKIEGNIRDGNT